MGLSEIKALKTFKQSFVLFTGAIGHPATGKSPAMGIIKALAKVESFLGIERAKSCQQNCEFNRNSLTKLKTKN